jgi:hypothetical protein
VRPTRALTGSTKPELPLNVYGGQLFKKLPRAGRVSTIFLLDESCHYTSIPMLADFA